MEKPASTVYGIHPPLSRRWSPRAFSSRPIEKEKLQRLFEAGRWAPSSYNQQEWRFIIGFRGDETHQKLFGTLVEFNQLWAGKAPVLILTCGQHTSLGNSIRDSIFSYDVGQAVAMLTIQATSEDLFVHQMSGFDKDKAAELFDLPDNVEPLTIMTIGYPGDISDLHPDLQPMEKSERVRENFDNFVFTGKFGQPSGLY
ncbi:MAG TPA: nitroreductase family protein [Bacteroidales bacterium]|nr:nitroreductase family protein [Bacteroidales bacterium]